MVISIVEIKMTRAIHLRPPGYHLISSGRQEEIFLARQKASYNSPQLVPYTHFPLSDPAGVGYSWCSILLLYSSFSPSRHCPFFYLLPVSMSLCDNTFLLHTLPFSSPPFPNELYIYLGLGDLRSCLSLHPSWCVGHPYSLVISSAQPLIRTFTDILVWIAEAGCCFDNAADKGVK